GNTTSYVKIGEPSASGLNVDLLDVVGGLLGLLDNDLVMVDVYNGGSQVPASEVSSTIVTDADGNNYIAVTSEQDYTGIKVKLKYRGNLLGLSIGASLKMKVYDAFYYTDGEKC